jgi:hypothetical protein
VCQAHAASLPKTTSGSDQLTSMRDGRLWYYAGTDLRILKILPKDCPQVIGYKGLPFWRARTWLQQTSDLWWQHALLRA